MCQDTTNTSWNRSDAPQPTHSTVMRGWSPCFPAAPAVRRGGPLGGVSRYDGRARPRPANTCGQSAAVALVVACEILTSCWWCFNPRFAVFTLISSFALRFYLKVLCFWSGWIYLDSPLVVPFWFSWAMVRSYVLNDLCLTENIQSLCSLTNKIFVKYFLSTLQMYILVWDIKILSVVIKYFTKVVVLFRFLDLIFFYLIYFWDVCFWFSQFLLEFMHLLL